MKFIIIIIGAIILLLGISILVDSQWIFDFFENNKNNQALYIIGILIRTVVGVLLLLSANESRHPFVINLLGFSSLLAALILTISLIYFGQESVQEFFTSVISEYKSYMPASGVFSVLVGGVLIYAFWGKPKNSFK